MIKVIQRSHYTGPILYSGIDLNPQSVIEAGTKIGSLSCTEVSGLLTGSFSDLGLTETLISRGIRLQNLNVLLFCDSLHWLQQNEVVELLEFLSHRVPSGTQVLANVCSVWNRTSIGTADNPRQRDNIAKITEYLKIHAAEPLSRTASEIEYSQNMTHFTPDSLRHIFVKAGFNVSDSSWWRNIFFPNGTPDLYENVNLTAYKD